MYTLKYPVDNPNISQAFGFDNTNHPLRKEFYKLFDNKHPGVDFSIPVGTKAFAAYPGIVVRRENHRGMGKIIATRNGNIVFLYAHISKFKVDFGEIVEQGDLIGLSGNTGVACNKPHLHFETRNIAKSSLNNAVFDPPFGKSIKQHRDTFSYKVNNKNTKKNWRSLSKLFFGTVDHWNTIRQANSHIERASDRTLPDSKKVFIPNYY